MKILQLVVSLISIVVIAGTVWLSVNARGQDIGPRIECDEEMELVVNVGLSREEMTAELLKHVTAYDEQDGDISDRIKIIYKNYFVDNKNTTLITFAACDSDNNVGRLQRFLKIEGYKSPKINLSYDFIFPSGYAYNLAKYITASDLIDGDITDNVKVISNEFANVEGKYPVNIKVSNSMADTTEFTINAIITDENWYDFQIRLNEYLAYIPVGGELDFRSYIRDIYKRVETNYTVDDIVIDSSGLDVTEPGVYEVYYNILNNVGETETMTRLFVVVEDEI